MVSEAAVCGGRKGVAEQTSSLHGGHDGKGEEIVFLCQLTSFFFPFCFF
jgi:hypothetical protein